MSGRPWRDNLRFFTAFLRRPRTVGAVLPSSRYLADLLVGELDLQAGDLVVEFGPGTGPMTAVIQKRLPAEACYLGIERDPTFRELLRQRFPSLRFHCGSADRLGEILAKDGLPRPRRIISGLPFASLPTPVQDGIIRGVDQSLADDGEFRTFQYTHAYWFPAARRFRTAMARRFPRYGRLGPVLRNVPPAWVLSYQR
jgi:phosphatidylethanolamine/phosphatidyl-N-methylethanolamine N-methyltransferase